MIFVAIASAREKAGSFAVVCMPIRSIIDKILPMFTLTLILVLALVQ